MSGAAEGEGQSKSESTEQLYAFVFYSRSLKELINIFYDIYIKFILNVWSHREVTHWFANTQFKTERLIHGLRQSDSHPFTGHLPAI